VTDPAINLDATRDPRIEGERIYLRRLRADDATERYRGWMNDPAINSYLESRFSEQSLDDLVAFVTTMRTDPLNLFTGIFLKADDRHIGNIKLGPINTHHARAEIGLLIGDRDCWGRGYATEAIAILTDFAFDRIGLRRVGAGAYADNEGSARAFEKAGYTREALFRDQWWHDGRFQDGVYLAKTNTQG
jgi:ribosomal-protein-alanine N-acetyltransferase